MDGVACQEYPPILGHTAGKAACNDESRPPAIMSRQTLFNVFCRHREIGG